MARVLIVDDELIFRKGLGKMVSDLGREWEVVGEARDGFEALDMLEQLRPQVLLTDIHMPRMDGIQLQQVARERFPDLLTVVVSGYDEFAYAQQSMRQGARDYLTKPIEREELARVMDGLRRELEERRLRPATTGEDPERTSAVRQQAARQLTEALLKGTLTSDESLLLEEMGIVLPHPLFICLVVKLDKHSVTEERYRRGDPSLFQLYIRQLVQEMLDRHAAGLAFVPSDTEVVALLNLEEDGQAAAYARSFGDMIRRQVSSLSNLTVTIGVSAAARGLAGIPRAYEEAEIALLHRLIAGGDRVLEYEMVGGTAAPLVPDTRRWSWDGLERLIRERDADGLGSMLERRIAELCSGAPSPEAIHQQICKLLLQCYELAGEMGVAEDWLESRDIGRVMFEVCALTSREELTEQCGLLLERLISCLAASPARRDADPVALAERYMEARYREPLTLKEVADEVFLNPAYFSNLFKQRTGVTFVERLTQLRVEEAKKRLAYTADKISAIAEETGFAHVRHFNRVFKSRTGLSPKEYREAARGSLQPKD